MDLKIKQSDYTREDSFFTKMPMSREFQEAVHISRFCFSERAVGLDNRLETADQLFLDDELLV